MWVSFISGLLFGLGLTVSNMVNPQRVLAFLDIFGRWDPTLAFVMGGALLVTVPGFFIVLKRSKPLFTESFSLPTINDIDKSLILRCHIVWAWLGFSWPVPWPGHSRINHLRYQHPIILCRNVN